MIYLGVMIFAPILLEYGFYWLKKVIVGQPSLKDGEMVNAVKPNHKSNSEEIRIRRKLK